MRTSLAAGRGRASHQCADTPGFLTSRTPGFQLADELPRCEPCHRLSRCEMRAMAPLRRIPGAPEFTGSEVFRTPIGALYRADRRARQFLSQQFPALRN